MTAVDSIEGSLGFVELVWDASIKTEVLSGTSEGSCESGVRKVARANGYEAPVYLTEYTCGGYRAKKLRSRWGIGAP